MTTQTEAQGSLTQSLIWLGVAAVVIVVVAYFAI
jgi:hypothetical protein